MVSGGDFRNAALDDELLLVAPTLFRIRRCNARRLVEGVLYWILSPGALPVTVQVRGLENS
jgi:hypothetical protein